MFSMRVIRFTLSSSRSTAREDLTFPSVTASLSLRVMLRKSPEDVRAVLTEREETAVLTATETEEITVTSSLKTTMTVLIAKGEESSFETLFHR